MTAAFIPEAPARSPVQMAVCKQAGTQQLHVVSHFPSWDSLYSREISHFLLTEGKICPTVTHCNFFQMVGGFYLVGDCAVLSRTHVY